MPPRPSEITLLKPFPGRIWGNGNLKDEGCADSPVSALRLRPSSSHGRPRLDTPQGPPSLLFWGLLQLTRLSRCGFWLSLPFGLSPLLVLLCHSLLHIFLFPPAFPRGAKFSQATTPPPCCSSCLSARPSANMVHAA